MPFDRSKYPKDWEEVSRRIRFERAQGVCEWPKCGAPNGELILRLKRNLENWRSPDGSDCGEVDPDYCGVKVILTVAHTCNCEPLCSNEEHLKALCQLHHLRLDAKLHARNSAKTRRRKKNNLELFDV